MSASVSARIVLVVLVAACASTDPQPAHDGPFGEAIAVDVELYGIGSYRVEEAAEVARIAACFGPKQPGNCNLGSFRFKVEFEHPTGGRATLLGVYGTWETFGQPAWSGRVHPGAEQVLATAMQRAAARAKPVPPEPVAESDSPSRLLMDPVIGDLRPIELTRCSSTWPWRDD